jgi:hypothetical protein
MKKIIGYMVLALAFGMQARADFRITSVKGVVFVRHNVQEDWVRAAVGDVLKPEDSMMLEKKSSSTILIDGTRRIVIPEFVILDLSDLRTLTQEELLLKLAMEDVRGVPGEERNDGHARLPGEIRIPKTTIIHGENKTPSSEAEHSPSQTATLQLNGARMLFDQGFYATCVLKTKEIVRQYPGLSNVIDAQIMVADALEKMKLKGEALSEYLNIPPTAFSPKQRSIVEGRIAQLKTKAE